MEMTNLQIHDCYDFIDTYIDQFLPSLASAVQISSPKIQTYKNNIVQGLNAEHM